jgi:membrane protein implicated in regulation of membrane protease activity
MTFGDFLSPFTIAVFIGAFGLLGLVARNGIKLSPEASLGFALPASMLVALALVYLFVKIFLASEGSSLVLLEDCVGTKAEVLVGINPGRIGSVAYIDKGTRLTLPARADGDQAFGKGDQVYICRLDGGTAWVKRDRPTLWNQEE